jgi:hypothetical protein
MNKFLVVFFIVISCFAKSIFAHTTHKKITNDNHSGTPLTSWVLSGYLDGSYNYLERSNQYISGDFNRDFDIEPNGFTFHQGSVTAAYQPKVGLGAVLNPMVGQDPCIFAPFGWNPGCHPAPNQVGIAVPQGYLQYATTSSTIIGGQILSLAGAENLDPTKDTNFSRSFLWQYEPTTLLGIRDTITINSNLSVIAGLNNGWDDNIDTRRKKTIELGFIKTFNSFFNVASYLYSGGQRIFDRTTVGPIGTRTLYDAILTFNVSKKLTYILNYDYGVQTKAQLPDGTIGQAVWQGIAGYLNYTFNDKWQTSIRTEVFDDKNGYRTGVPQTVKEFTITLGYTPTKNFEIRAETRHDFSNVNSYLNKNLRSTSDNQLSYALEAFYKFG